MCCVSAVMNLVMVLLMIVILIYLWCHYGRGLKEYCEWALIRSTVSGLECGVFLLMYMGGRWWERASDTEVGGASCKGAEQPASRSTVSGL